MNKHLSKNKYRVNSVRLHHWDYSCDGCYFVTICTKGFVEYFGNIFENKVQLSRIGKIAEKCWREIPKHFSNIQLDKYIIMPNHVHGIIVIYNPDNYDVGAADLLPLHTADRTKMLLSKIIHGFKSSITRIINRMPNNIPFSWQRSFYDHVIRNEKDLIRIREYIYNNPLKWEFDRSNPRNL